MPALLSWVLLLGGIATTVAAAALSAEVEFEAAIALGGLLATLVGAVGLLLSRVAGDAPRDLRPPGATSRVNLPTGPAPASIRGRRSGRGRAREPGRGSASERPNTVAIPTGPTRAGPSRIPVLLAALGAGAAWSLTMTEGSTGPLDILVGILFLITPLAIVAAIATRLVGGRAWGPAVAWTTAGLGAFVGSVVADLALGLAS
ncbi:MAG: hypothetical protein ABWY52_01540 [Candidatus Limnocylindrales bacterium]